jgi:hypothetical protein
VLTGYNTDVLFEGKTFHVQTEDRGAKNPVIDTLVYCGGQILHQEKRGYADLIEAGGNDVEVARRLDRQHRELVRRVRHGEFLRLVADADTPAIGGDLLAALGEFCSSDDEMVWLELDWVARKNPTEGGTLRVTRRDSGEPQGGAEVRIRCLEPGKPSRWMELATTRDDGIVDFKWTEPINPEASLVIVAEAGPGGGRLRVSGVSAAIVDAPTPA